jgi:hypothetical protein
MDSETPKVVLKDARGTVIGDENAIYQYFLADDRGPALAERLLTFTSLIEDKTRHFVGRDFLMRKLDSFLLQQPSGYFVITGLPGIGKTALIAELVKRRHYIHHFNEVLSGTTTTEQFLQSVCVQLITSMGLSRAYDVLAASRSSHYLSELLEEASGPESGSQKIVIAVDALDEAESLSDLRSNALLLPPRLPKGIYFVVTSRIREELQLRVECPEEYFYLDSSGDDNMEDVRIYLENAAQGQGMRGFLERAALNPTVFVDTLIAKSEGNFMYLRYVVPEIEAGRYPELKLKDLPQGLIGYYNHHWRRMRASETETWVNDRQPVISILAAVREPVSPAQLSRFSGVPLPRVRAALHDWREFLDERRNDGERKYSIYHSSFQEFLLTKAEVGEINLQDSHRQIGRSLLDEWQEEKMRQGSRKGREAEEL